MRLTKKTLLFSCLLSTVAVAQDKIDTDRPTEGQSAQLVDKGALQFEAGFRKQQENKVDYTLHHPEAVLRYGILKQLELRLTATATSERIYSKSMFNYGLEPVELGLKAHLFQSKDTSFTTALYAQVGMPKWASRDHKLDGHFYRLRALFQNKLTEKIKLSYNVGRDWNSTEKQQTWLYTLSPQFELSEKWAAFIEEYGSFQKGHKPEHYIDGGLAYYVSYNIMLDVNAGKGITHNAADYFFTTGISFRLK